MSVMYEKIIKGMVDDTNEAMYFLSMQWGQDAESPIELAMMQALYLHAHTKFYSPRFWRKKFGELKIGQKDYVLTAQHQECEYRVDIVVVYGTDTTPVRIAIECDGHDFHEKTKEQAARDKKRDRVLAQRFDAVLRFTGSEIYRDPWGCAKQVEETLMALLYRRDEASTPTVTD